LAKRPDAATEIPGRIFNIEQSGCDCLRAIHGAPP
jgi:hypothetical protein